VQALIGIIAESTDVNQSLCSPRRRRDIWL